jgi:hypothetical protein
LKNYLINQTYLFEGEWWHSSDDMTRFAGELKYAPQEDKVELVIWGASELLQIDFYNDTFLGETTDGLKLTLTHLQRSHSTSTISQYPKYVHTVQVAGAVIVGMHFNKIEDIYFSPSATQIRICSFNVTASKLIWGNKRRLSTTLRLMMFNCTVITLLSLIYLSHTPRPLLTCCLRRQELYKGSISTWKQSRIAWTTD